MRDLAAPLDGPERAGAEVPPDRRLLVVAGEHGAEGGRSPGGGSGGRDREVRRRTLGERGVPEQRHDQRREHHDPRCQSCSGELGGGQHACFVLDYRDAAGLAESRPPVRGPTHADHAHPTRAPRNGHSRGHSPPSSSPRPSKRSCSPLRTGRVAEHSRAWTRTAPAGTKRSGSASGQQQQRQGVDSGGSSRVSIEAAMTFLAPTHVW